MENTSNYVKGMSECVINLFERNDRVEEKDTRIEGE